MGGFEYHCSRYLWARWIWLEVAQLRLLLRLGRDFAVRMSKWFRLAEAAPFSGLRGCCSLSTTLRYPNTCLQDMQIWIWIAVHDPSVILRGLHLFLLNFAFVLPWLGQFSPRGHNKRVSPHCTRCHIWRWRLVVAFTAGFVLFLIRRDPLSRLFREFIALFSFYFCPWCWHTLNWHFNLSSDKY